MESNATTISSSSSLLQSSFEDLEKQKALITSCTLLWKELSDHFTSLEKDLQIKSETLRSRLQTLDRSTQLNLESLHCREQSIDGSVDLALNKVDERRDAVLLALAEPDPPDKDLSVRLRSFCTKIDAKGFWDLLVSKRKEVEGLRSELSLVLSDCVDPAKFAMDTISRVFPVDQTSGKDANDLGWACVMILESLVPVLADPELGSARPLITPSIRQRAREIADTWKEGLDKRGGVECAKPPDVHTFLQHVVTFGVVANEDKELYRKLVMNSSWRKQMPKLALCLGLGDSMIEMIEELISKGQQLDAVNFTFEAGVEDKFPPVPLLKSYLEESKKAATSILEDRNNSGRAAHLASRKEQSALRAVIKCIEDHKLETDFSPDTLQKRLGQLEKTKIEKKKQVSGPAAIKRTRANNGGPMPPAKAGRLTTNHAHVSSFPAIPVFVRSPSAPHSPLYQAAAITPPYAYDRPMGPATYGSRSPPAIRDPYAYHPPQEEVAHAALGMSYPCAPVVNYPLYGGAYTNGLLLPGYQQTYYR